MKVKNIILTVLASATILASIMPTSVNATTVGNASPKELGIVSQRTNERGYQVNSRNVWKIVEYKNGTYTYDNAFYCVKAGQGFGDSSYIANREYDASYDMKNLASIPNAVKSILPTDTAKTETIDGDSYTYTNYNAVLWLLDNMYLPKDTNAVTSNQALLNRVFPNGTVLKDDDIEVVQQCALWYFTNPSDTDPYHMETLPAVQVSKKGNTTTFELTLDDVDGWNATTGGQTEAAKLYSELIKMAKMNAEDYGTENDRETVSVPAVLQATAPKAEVAKGECIVGPFILNQTSTNYEITGTLTDQNDNPVAYTILNSNKQEVAEGTTLKDMGNSTFYLKIADDKDVTSLTFSTEVRYGSTATILWTVGGAELTEQPVVEVKKITKTNPQEFNINIDRKYFDLALRKFITSINGVGTTGREPEVDTDTLKTGTTATYEHSKMPLSVAPGDIVTYRIRIFNEGQVDGYAEEIADYIPEGLGFIIGHNVNSDNRWVVSDGQNLSTVKLSTIPNATTHLKLSDFTDITDLSKVEVVKGNAKITTDKLKYNENDTKKLNLIPAYDEELATIYSRDVEVVCVVLGDVTQQTNLKNIAEITKYVDEYGYVVTGPEGKVGKADGLGTTLAASGAKISSVEDRDSTSGNVNLNTYPANTNVEDDDDYEQLVVKDFDLALRKFITAVGTTKITDRKPIPTINSTTGAITYQHPKDVVRVKNGDLVEYTIRVYNEGAVAGYATEVRDTLPAGLEFAQDNATNEKYGWTPITGDANTFVTSYLSFENGGTQNLIPAFDRGTMTSPEFKELVIVCKVNVPNNSSEILINTAEIEDDAVPVPGSDQPGDVTDKDSTPGNNKPGEDDIDTEKVQIVIFDLSLKKFITQVNETDVTDRVPEVTFDEQGNINYTYKKDPVEVVNGDTVVYTIRVYNEGNIAGFAEEIKDDVPEGLVFLKDNEINKEFLWDVNEKGEIRTNYLSSELSEDNEIQAFDKNDMDTLDYREVKVAFAVDEANLPADRIIINTAEISKDKNEYNVPDEDSTPDNDVATEDDIDKEYLKVKYFDLALLKYITQVQIVEDGNLRVVETGHTGEENPEPMVKVEINKNKINTTKVTFLYTIKVMNQGEIAGYATEIEDRIPQGLAFYQEDNPEWYQGENGNAFTNQLAGTLLNPGDSAEVQIALRWVNGEENLKEKVNIAEINKDYNDSNSKDIDSTPGNGVEEEDDQDDATVLLSIKTGGVEPSYMGLFAAGLAILGVGVVLIRKYII